MAKTSFDIQLRNLQTKEIYYDKIEGYEFEYEGIKLVVHKSISSNKEWTVSEPVTGLNVLPYAIHSKKEAEERMRNRIESYTPEKFKSIIDKGIEKAAQQKENSITGAC